MGANSPPPGGPARAQLPLKLVLDEEATFSSFMTTAASAAVCAALQDSVSEPLQFLHGGEAVGKSHLLQARCHLAAGGALYLPLAELSNLDPGRLLLDLEAAPCIALDDLHCVAGDERWEEALFHLINRCRGSGTELLFAARRPPGELGVQLADLRSRLAGGVTWALPGYTEEEKRAILVFRARHRGLDLTPAVLDYLVARVSRSLGDLIALLERLDEASLQAQRPLTVPLAREVLALSTD